MMDNVVVQLAKLYLYSLYRSLMLCRFYGLFAYGLFTLKHFVDVPTMSFRL